MKIFIPSNIFTAAIALSLPNDLKEKFEITPSSEIAAKLEMDNDSVGFIPSLDIINHKELFVSKIIGISFDGNLSNSYLYFSNKGNDFNRLNLAGDVSINEILISKILFKEHYSKEIEITLSPQRIDFGLGNFLISGNDNFYKEYYENGMSFSDLTASMLEYPYVNFILASSNKELLEKFNELFHDTDKRIENNLEIIFKNLDVSSKVYNYFKKNYNSVYFELTENELNSYNEMLRIIFYNNIMDEIVEPKFV